MKKVITTISLFIALSMLAFAQTNNTKGTDSTCTADFYFYLDTIINTPNYFHFIDSSTGSPTTWHWDFGDGATSSLQNPDHQFSVGIFIVCLTISDSSSGCYDMYCDTVDVCIDTSIIDLGIFCPAVIQPVCGCDSVTYNNDCEAYNWFGVTSWTQGVCNSGQCIDTNLIDKTVMCPYLWNPVCGCDSVTYANDCIAFYYFGLTSWTIGPCGTAGINTSEHTLKIGEVYPNPVIDNANIEVSISKTTEIKLAVYNLVGQRVYDFNAVKNAGTHNLFINTTGLTKGMYLLEVSTADGVKQTKKFSKVK